MPPIIDESLLAVLRGNIITTAIVALLEEHNCATLRLSPVEYHTVVRYFNELGRLAQEGQREGAISAELLREQLEANVDFVRCELVQLLRINEPAAKPVTPSKSWKISWGDIVFQTVPSTGKRHVLGTGAFGKVYAATYKGATVAVKQFVRAGVDSCLDYFKQEVGALSKLRHPAIIQFYGATLRNPADPNDASEYAIVMERGAMTLLEAMNVMRDPEALATCSVPLPLTIDDKLKLLGSLAEGLMYLHHHDPPIVLQDIKPSNVILTADGKAKFIDFGFATVKATTVNTRSRIAAADVSAAESVRIVHTPQYAAPEVLHGLVHHPQREQDIYSFGVLCYELLTGAVRASKGSISAQELLSLTALNNDAFRHVCAVVAACTVAEARYRPTAKQLFHRLVAPGECSDWSVSSRERHAMEPDSHFFVPLHDGTTPLILACLLNDYNSASLELKRGVFVRQVNARDARGATALHAACQSGCEKIAVEMIAGGADVDAAAYDGTTPLIVACLNRRVQVACRLLDAGADINRSDHGGFTPLGAAMKVGCVELGQLLVSRGAKVDAAQLMSIACRNGCVDSVEFLFERFGDINQFVSKSKMTPLAIAAGSGFRSLASWLVAHGARCNEPCGDGRSAVHTCCANGHSSTLEFLLDKAADVNAVCKRLQTPLHEAARNGHADVVKKLIERNADVNALDRESSTPLHLAADEGRTPVIRVLLDCDKGVTIDATRDHGQTPLHRAARNGHLDAVRALVARGADVHAEDDDNETPLKLAIRGSHAQVVIELVRCGSTFDMTSGLRTPLLNWAAKAGDERLVEELLKEEENVNCADATGETALHCAALWGRVGVVDLLIGHGANVCAASNEGKTPLHCAARAGHVAIAETLLRHGANVHAARSDGQTPLHTAACCGQTAVARALIRWGADVNCRRNDGHTALHRAAHFGHLELVRVLVELNADVDAEDNNKRTPLQVANENGEVVTAAELMNFGKKKSRIVPS